MKNACLSPRDDRIWSARFRLGVPDALTAAMDLYAINAIVNRVNPHAAPMGERSLIALLSLREAGSLMALSPADVEAAVGHGEVLGVRNDADLMVPEWQFDANGRPHRGVREVIGHLGNGWSALHFLLSLDAGCPRALLIKAGMPDAVVRDAALAACDYDAVLTN